MSELPPNPHESDPVDELYRRASALDASRPSESVRRAVLDHAAQLAALAASQGAGRNQPGVGRDQRRPAPRRMWWKPAAFGTLAAAGLAGLLITPQFLTPRTPRVSMTSTAGRPKAQAREPDATDAAGPAPEGAAQGGAQSAAPIAAQNDAKSAPAEEVTSVTAQRRAVASNKTAASSKAAEADSLTAQDNVNGPVSYSEQSHAGQSDAQLAGNQSASGAVTSAEPARPAMPATPAAPAAFTAAKVPAASLMDTGAQLRRSAESGDVVALRALLDKQPAVDARDGKGRTALMLATLQGRSQAVDMLLSAGADPNATDAQGATPLQAALTGNQSAIAAALRRAGAR